MCQRPARPQRRDRRTIAALQDQVKALQAALLSEKAARSDARVLRSYFADWKALVLPHSKTDDSHVTGETCSLSIGQIIDNFSLVQVHGCRNLLLFFEHWLSFMRDSGTPLSMDAIAPYLSLASETSQSTFISKSVPKTQVMQLLQNIGFGVLSQSSAQLTVSFDSLPHDMGWNIQNLVYGRLLSEMQHSRVTPSVPTGSVVSVETFSFNRNRFSQPLAESTFSRVFSNMMCDQCRFPSSWLCTTPCEVYCTMSEWLDLVSGNFRENGAFGGGCLHRGVVRHCGPVKRIACVTPHSHNRIQIKLFEAGGCERCERRQQEEQRHQAASEELRVLRQQQSRQQEQHRQQAREHPREVSCCPVL